ncbi:MAG: 4Fe-4S binding protein [Candidatus Omnitrophica bacterium]|nr:4Fe-4S binding protein [Candidatus Omnitrophota bacterium]
MPSMVFARRISQGFFLLSFIYVLWSTAYPLAGQISPDILFKIDPLIMLAVSLSERIILPGAVFFLSVLAMTAVLGRFFCGWVCPLGTAIDIAGTVNRTHKGLSDKKNSRYRRIKFYILAVIFLLALFGKQVAWIFDPIVIMGRFVSLNLIPSVTNIINSLFFVLIKHLGAGPAVKDFYHMLKPTMLGVKTFYFAHSAVIFIFFSVICAGALILRRSWCRILCPLGALYAIVGSLSPLRRSVKECVKCGQCKSFCRMGAIKDDLSYIHNECILCMDCIYDCPGDATRFKIVLGGDKRVKAAEETKASTVSRRNFLLILLGSVFALGAKTSESGLKQKVSVIRPPGAIAEEDFVNRCIRCGNCMKVCPTNALHPVMLQAGIEGVWTPQMLPEIGYCEYRCALCGRTCPTGALPELTPDEKSKTKLGTAVVDQSICLPWAEGKECLVCQEHCPVSEKAIKLDTYAGGPAKPYVDGYLCVGCGICQNKCPVRPVRAIRVTSDGATRGRVTLGHSTFDK